MFEKNLYDNFSQKYRIIIMCKNFFKIDDRIKFFKKLKKIYMNQAHYEYNNYFSSFVFFQYIFSFELKNILENVNFYTIRFHIIKNSIALQKKIIVQIFFKKYFKA